jgi:threonine dehydrogenase-like Zn-dependent dehydrogenase
MNDTARDTTCRAAVFLGDGSYQVRQFAVPSPPPGGAVLRVEAVGLCGSDLAQLRGHHHVPGEVSPVVPGHEIVGRVHQVDADSTLGVTVGQRVAVDLVRRCGSCPACSSGSALCSGMRLYGYTFPLDERSGLYGGYGEYMEVLPGSHLLPLTDAVAAEELTLFEPLANACNWLSAAGVKTGTSVVIQGPGHIGLVCTALAHALGASPIVVTGRDRDALRLAVAAEVGADHTIDVDGDDAVAGIAEITGGAMADVVLDVADDPATVQGALEMVRFGGTVVLAGLKDRRTVGVVSDLVPLKALTVQGGSGSTAESMEAAVSLLNAGRIPTAPLKGEVFQLEDIDTAMRLLSRFDPDRDAVRVGLLHP